jgi:hypothetical protein
VTVDDVVRTLEQAKRKLAEAKATGLRGASVLAKARDLTAHVLGHAGRTPRQTMVRRFPSGYRPRRRSSPREQTTKGRLLARYSMTGENSFGVDRSDLAGD